MLKFYYEANGMYVTREEFKAFIKAGRFVTLIAVSSKRTDDNQDFTGTIPYTIIRHFN